jgi:hypothetical protein
VFVCTPTLDDEILTRVREAFPGALCLATASAQDAKIGIFDENPYWSALTAAFDSTLCIRNLDTGNVVRIYSPDLSNPDAVSVPTFVLRQESADALVAFHRDVTMQASWDGLYIDMCTASFPLHRKRRLEEISPNYDIDDDGSADTREDIDRNYDQWRPYYTARLRDVVGEHRVIIGNSAGALIDPSLNGITLEKVGERVTLAQARDYFTSHAAATSYPPLSVAWIFSTLHQEASARIAAELDYVLAGDVVE